MKIITPLISSEKLLTNLVENVITSVKASNSVEDTSSVDDGENEKKAVNDTLQELWTNSRQNIIELRKFGNLLLEETSSVDYTEIEKKVINKKLEEKEELVKQIFQQTLDRIINKTFDKIRQTLNPQVISVFLFSKNGCIEKYKTWGKDRNNKDIENGWLKDERYNRGQSFSGKAAQGDPYGEPHFSNNLDEETRIGKLSYGKHYEEKLGFLKCGISVPLDSNYRTFGTIEVLILCRRN